MAINIEILDYKYGTGNNLVDATRNSSIENGAFTVTDKDTIVHNSNGSGIDWIYDICDVIIGLEYLVSFDIEDYTGSGNVGFGVSGVGVPTSLKGAANGNYTATFVATATGSIDVFGYDTNTATINNISVQATNAIDWERSVIGSLDITDHSEFPLAITFSIADIKNIDARSGAFSKTFKIPATKNNNRLFKHLHLTNSNIDNNILGKKRCRIIVDGIPMLEGLIKITGIESDGDMPKNYSCVFYGDNLSWAKEVEGKYVKDLYDNDSNNEGFQIRKSSIESYWDDVDVDSGTTSLTYPLASYGKVNADGFDGMIQLLKTAYDASGTGSTNKLGYYGFWDSGTPYPTPEPELDWRPMVWVKDTISKIFKDSGYNVVSDFMNTDLFKRLVWALPNAKYNNQDEREDLYRFDSWFTSEGLIQNDSYVVASGFSTIGDSPVAFINFDNAGSDFVIGDDALSNFDTTDGSLEIGEYGYHDISLKNIGFYIKGTSSVKVATVKLKVYLKSVGQTTYTYTEHSEIDYLEELAPKGFKFKELNFRRYFNKGDKIKISYDINLKSGGSSNSVEVYLFGASKPTSETASDNANGSFSCEFDGQYMEYGQTYDLTDIINPDYKQMDFLKGVSHAFNLQMTTDESTKSVKIEPFNDFYLPLGDAIDWSSNLAREKAITTKWIKSDIKRELVFKYKKDEKDKKVEKRAEDYWKGLNDEQPYFEDLGDQFEKGESKFENPFFAGTFCTRDADLHPIKEVTFNTACLWEEASNEWGWDRADKGYEFKPRLLYFNSESTGSSISEGFVAQTWNSTTGEPEFIDVPRATSVDRHNINSPNLCYGKVKIRDYDPATQIQSYAVMKDGLYDTYYKNMITMLIDKPRVITAYFDLKITDIMNLDFRKLIYLDGVYYRLNKISDYKPNQNTATKVELIEWKQ